MPIDLSKFKEIFLSEAKTYIKTMNTALLELEKNPEEEKSFQQLIRAVHTLKSLTGTMNYNHSMNLCHSIEDLLEQIREKKIALDICIDLLFQCFDYLNLNLKELEKSENELDLKSLIEDVQNILKTGHKPLQNATSSTPGLPSMGHEKIQAIEVKVERLDNLMNLTEELIVNKMKFDLLREKFDHPELISAIESFGRLIIDLQYQVMQIRMVPIGFIFNRFIRMARDLAKKQKKEINIIIEGVEIELDRLLLDEIGESIVHLIRNAIDHGLEPSHVRKNLNKPLTGNLLLKASRSKEFALIEVTDDGAGLDLQLIKDLAIKNKIIKGDASSEEVIEAIFSSLSTKKMVTEVSGRGLGLSIVKQKIESIGGHIRVESSVGKGTSFYIEIPLNLAIINTLFVNVSGETYAIPLDAVERLLVVSTTDFKGFFEREAIIYENTDIPIVQLADLFGLVHSKGNKQSIVIIHKENKHLGLVVDSLLSTQEVVIKPLGISVRKNKFFSGAALVGSGKMVLILDVDYLLRIKRTDKTIAEV